MGYVGNEPQVSVVTGGLQRSVFSVATRETYIKKDGSPHEETSWHDCVAWGKVSENVEKFVTKGTLVFIEGSISYWEAEKDGVKIKRASVKVNTFTVVKSMKETGQKQISVPTVSQQKQVDNSLALPSFENNGVVTTRVSPGEDIDLPF